MELNFNGFQNFEEFYILYYLIFKKSQNSKVFSKDKCSIYYFSINQVKQKFLQNFDLLKLSIQYYQEILKNRSVKKLPVAINLTFSLVKYLEDKKQYCKQVGSIIVNSLNQIVDLNQKQKTKQSFLQTLLKLQFEQDAANIISEFRHSFTHKIFPSKDILDFVVAYLLRFLQINFWKITLKKNMHKLEIKKLEQQVETILKTFDESLDLSYILNECKNKLKSKDNSLKNQIQILMNCRDTIGIRKKIKKMKIKNVHENILKNLLKQQNIKEDQQKINLLQNFLIENMNISTFRNYFKKQKFKNTIYKILLRKDYNKNFEEFWDLFYSNFDRILRKDNFINKYLNIEKKDTIEIDQNFIEQKYQQIIHKDQKNAFKKIFINFYINQFFKKQYE